MTLAPARPGVRLLISHALAATAMSMPWPALLAAVWADTGSDAWLGLAGASRMLPYVVLSAVAGILADRLPRVSVIRWSTAVRAVLLAGCGAVMAAGSTELAVVLAVCTVAAGTPAYPAAVARLPQLVGPQSRVRGGASRLTNLLVTAEVTAFVVGPAIGGLLIGLGHGLWSIWGAAACAAVAWPLLHRLDAGRPSVEPLVIVGGRLRTVLTSPGVPLAIAMVALANFVEAGASVALINLNAERWGVGDRGFGIATAAFGFGSLAAPLLACLVRLRGSLAITGTGFAIAGLAPAVTVAVAPLAAAGAAGTTVECVCTDVLQQSVPDHVRAFSLGLTDSIMVSAAMLGSMIAPVLASAIGARPVFMVFGAGVGLASTVVFRRARHQPSASTPVAMESRR